MAFIQKELVQAKDSFTVFFFFFLFSTVVHSPSSEASLSSSCSVREDFQNAFRRL